MGKTCFIISPIGKEGSEIRKNSDLLFTIILRPVLEECGYQALRADMIPVGGMINPHIIRHIVEDDLTIADLTGMNPNVFYELAIRHVIGKPYVHLIREGEQIPFDVKDIHTISYSIDVETIERAKAKIRAQIDYFEAGNEVISPFTMTMDILARQKPDHTAATLQAVMDQLSRLESSMDQLSRLESSMNRFPPNNTKATDELSEELSDRLQAVTLEITRTLDGMKDRIAESVTSALVPTIREAARSPIAEKTSSKKPELDYQELLRREPEGPQGPAHRQRGAPNTYTVSEFLEREAARLKKSR